MMPEKMLIDTDVIIDYLRGYSKAVSFLSNVQTTHQCYITTITMAELYSGVREGTEKKIMDNFILEFSIANINSSSAKKAGLYRRDFGKSHGVGLADCMIAAIADDLHAVFVTLNSKYFPMLKNIKVPYLK